MKQKKILIVFMVQAFIFNLTNVITPGYLNSLGVEKYYFGYFAAFWSLGMLISSPVWGALGDLYGRKKFAILGLIIYGLSQLVFFYSSNVAILSVMRIVSGIGVGAPVTLLLSHMIGSVSRSETGKYLALRMGFLTVGSTVAYKVSGYLGLVYQKELFLVQSLLSIFLIFIVIILIKEKKEPHCVLPKQFNMFSSIKHLKLLSKDNIIFLVSITLTTMTFVNIDKFIDLYVIDSGYDSLMLGNLKMVFGILTIIINLVVLPKMKKYLGSVYILQSIQIFMAIIALIVFSDSRLIIMLYTLFLLYVVLRAIFTTSEQLFLASKVSRKDMGLFMGLRQSFTCLGMVVGPIIGGHIYQTEPRNLFIFSVVCLLLSSSFLAYIQNDTKDYKQKNYVKA
jgi:DHA1 family multidrug resistance protein-like MFS transporter